MKNITSLLIAITLIGNLTLAAFNEKPIDVLATKTIAKADSSILEDDKDSKTAKNTNWRAGQNRFSKVLTRNIYTGFKKTAQEDWLFESNQLKITKAYPNPAGEAAYMDYNMLESIRAKVTIRNLLGRVVKEYDLQEGKRQIKIPTVQFDSGIYFYSLSINGKALKAKKLVVEHR
ncbi:MAG: T9SS type A sorting domain-containing protein [Microscillaceae bacterium]|jgi:hypothetical protein|nr:T9SS type A sorting domain-containing protein [Microscillaceae bacterium]